MSILPNGKRLDGSPLVRTLEADAFGERIAQNLGANVTRLRQLTATATFGQSYRAEMERRRSVDLNNPREAGWTYLIRGDGSDAAAIIEAVRPLAEHRGMKDPAQPIRFGGEPIEEWLTWLEMNYFALDLGEVPRYVLIIGTPNDVPFLLQSLLDTSSSVGRVSFDSVDELRAYAEKVVRLETATEPVVDREALFFAPDGGYGDATFYSRRYMAEPLASRARESNWVVNEMVADAATKEEFLRYCRTRKPGLVYSASHGLGDPSLAIEVQKPLEWRDLLSRNRTAWT